MIIWHVPENGTRENLYGALLVEALRARGVVVRELPYRHLWALPALSERPDAIHFEFVDPYILPHVKSLGAIRALVKGILFLVQCILLRLAGVRLCWTIHDIGTHEGRLWRTEWVFTTLFARLAHGFLTHTAFAKDRAIAVFHLGGKARLLRHVPHPSYAGAYPDEVTPEAARAALGVAPKALVFLCLGQFRPYKRLAGVVEAFKAAFPKGSDTVLIVAGSDAGHGVGDDLVTRSEGRPDIRIIRDHVPDSDLQLYYRAADFAVLNYAIPTSGAAVLAMGFGRAVIAPRAGGLADVLDEQGAIFFDEGREDGLHRALLAARERRGEASQMGKHNAAKSSGWTWDALADELLSIYCRDRNT